MASPDFTSSDPYRILGVARNASDKDIRKAYYQLARKFHPDKNKSSKSSAEIFKKVGEAYSILSDAEKKRNFDTTGSATGSAHSGASAARHPRDMSSFVDLFNNFHSMFGSSFESSFSDPFDDPFFGGSSSMFGRGSSSTFGSSSMSRGFGKGADGFFGGGFGSGFGDGATSSSSSFSSFSGSSGGTSRSVSTSTRTGPDGRTYKVTKTTLTRPDGSVETSETSDVFEAGSSRALPGASSSTFLER